MNNTAYLEFMNYANEKIQRARQCIIQFNDNVNLLEVQEEQLEILVSMFNRLLLNISENGELYQVILTYLREIQVLLNQYMTQISQLGDEEFVDVNLFITKKISAIGRPKIVISIEALRLFRREGFSYTDIAKMMGVCTKTIKRRRNELNIPDDLVYTEISNEELDNLLRSIRLQQPYSGQQIIMGMIRSLGIKIHRERLRDSLHRIDTFGTLNRWSQFSNYTTT
ncbi:unnamed protein product [Rhizophagus irregularis]|nr:unnamed protein product [Rhizophagus irregularis]